MNAPFRTPLAVSQPNELAGLLAAHRQIRALQDEHQFLPDEAWDSLDSATLKIKEEVASAAAESSPDIAIKLRLLADLMDSDDGAHRSCGMISSMRGRRRSESRESFM